MNNNDYFEYEYYVNRYKDLSHMNKEQALRHFIKHGIKEKRKFNKLLDSFDYNYYITKYKDLSKMNYLEACNHYIKHGIKEKRDNCLPKQKNETISKYYDITVIVNSYNPEEKDLVNSINSILNQIKIKVKIFVVTIENDVTINYINNINNNNIKLIICDKNKHPGKGPKGIYYQLNEGLKHVTTKYYSYFSSNDIMKPTKLYNEIEKIKKDNSIFCFSKYNNVFPNKTISFEYDINRMNFDNLIKTNFINDCATIDLEKLSNKLQFNYEKFENVCYWELWLSLLQKYGNECMSYNDNIEWDYIRIESKSQAMKRNKNKNEIDRYNNLKEFMLSYYDFKIEPNSIYKYNNDSIWWWNDTNNKKSITMTVALPALNASKIIWLALESLKNQVNIDFAWELICFEEEGISKKIIKSYKKLLPGCARIIYRRISKDDAFYKIEDINKNGCTSYYTLLEKWINIAKYADNNSVVFVKHAVDCYSPPKRLFIHNEHFKNKMCYYSTQPMGYFYNIKEDKWMLYNGNLIEPIVWDINFTKNGINNNYNNNTNIKIRGCHLNMALRTNIMKIIPLPQVPKRSGLDGYILFNISIIIKIRPEEKKIIFTDVEIDSDNWKYSLDTDGFNNISLGRSNLYNIQKYKNYIIEENKPDNCKIPEYIFNQIKKITII